MNTAGTSVIFQGGEAVLLGIVLSLAALLCLFMLYAVWHHILDSMKRRSIAGKMERWEKILLKYVEFPERSEIAKLRFGDGEWMIFGEFIEHYLSRLKGEQHERAVKLLWEMNFHTPLLKALKSAKAWERAYSAHCLGLMNFTAAEPNLVKLSYDKSPYVSLVAFESLQLIATKRKMEPIIARLLNIPTISSSKVFNLLLSFGEDVHPLLIEMLGYYDVSTKGKRVIVDIMAYENARESAASILDLAEKTDDPELIIGCIKALGKFKYAESSNFLFRCLSSSDWVVRSQAIGALGGIVSEEIIPVLLEKLLNDRNTWVKLYSARALAGMGDRGIQVLHSLLSENRGRELNDMINYVFLEHGA